MKIRPIFKTIDIFSFIQFLSRQTNYIIKFFLLKVLYLVFRMVHKNTSIISGISTAAGYIPVARVLPAARLAHVGKLVGRNLKIDMKPLGADQEQGVSPALALQ